MWVVNPFAAALLVPPAHLWMLVVAPELRLRRGRRRSRSSWPRSCRSPWCWRVYAARVGLGLLQLPWSLLLLVAGGQVGVLALVALWRSARAAASARVAPRLRAAAGGAGTAAPRHRARADGLRGPGSLGGTESALRRAPRDGAARCAARCRPC